ncbi:hypothetical protein PYCC9005_001698 [Savitreella phatthalungensis]
MPSIAAVPHPSQPPLQTRKGHHVNAPDTDKENIRPHTPMSGRNASKSSLTAKQLRDQRKGFRDQLRFLEERRVDITQASSQLGPSQSRSLTRTQQTQTDASLSTSAQLNGGFVLEDDQEDTTGTASTDPATFITPTQTGPRLLKDVLQRANTLYATVERPQEANLDSRVLLHTAALAQTCARNIKRGRETLSLDEFMGKVATLCKSNDPSRDAQRAGLEKLAQIFTRNSMRPPTSDFLLGPLQMERRERVQHQAREHRRHARGEQAKPKELTERDTVGVASSNSTTKQTMLVARILQQESPIDLFTFVCNPKSFSQTVENIFSLAFLVREGRARIYENDEGLQVVEAIDPSAAAAAASSFSSSAPASASGFAPGSSDSASKANPQNNMDGKDGKDRKQQDTRDHVQEKLRKGKAQHGVVTIDMATWKEAVELLELTESTIPHRQEIDRLPPA